MSPDIERIKKMQADGKITKEQALRLMKALPGGTTLQKAKTKNVSIKSLLFVFMLLAAGGASVGIIAFRANSTNLHSLSAQTTPAIVKQVTGAPALQATPAEFEKAQNKKRPNPVYQITEMSNTSVASQGELLVLKNGKKLILPLMHTNVTGKVEGYLARVTVTQKFVNLTDTTIEAVYTLPLPENAAVDSMIMHIGNRRIKGNIKERGEARAVYEQARRDGKSASLLEQERPNIFTQSVANILKNDTILVTISYVQELKFVGGNYQFVFPMVVGPRYIPGAPLRTAEKGTQNPTDQVPDADKITPPLLPPGVRSGHDISLRLTINAGTDIRTVSCPSHKIMDVINDDKTRSIEILSSDNIPNKDFILDYSMAQKEIGSIVLYHNQNNNGFLQLIMTPQLSTKEADIFARELVFIVDNSGSMGGFPIEKCKEVITLCLKNMRKDDIFRLIKFAGSAEELSTKPLHASPQNIDKALSYVDQMSGRGGTEMLTPIKALFDAPQVDGRRRLVFFLTDGYVGNGQAILATIRERLGTTRVFSLGVGSSVNRHLLEGMAYNGRGVCMYIRQDGNAQKTMDEFYSFVDAPVLTDIQLHFDGIEISETAPRKLPDLFAGQPLVVIGKYSKPGKGKLTIEGRLAGDRTFKRTIDIVLPKEEKDNGVLATLWARRKIAEIDLLGSRLMADNAYTPDTVKEQITRLGLQYRIMTQYTSFVAVDDAIRNETGKWVTKVQAVEVPEGVSPGSQPAERYTDVGRKGMAGIGYGAGYGSGFGGSSSNLDAVLSGTGGLKSGGGGGGGLDLKKRGSLSISAPEFSKGGALRGGRSKASIMRVVMQNLAALRYAYHKRLLEKPELQGKIVVKFAIDSLGKVISCSIVESTMQDPDFEKTVVEKVSKWTFEKIDKKDDVTEIVYPFIFSK